MQGVERRRMQREERRGMQIKKRKRTQNCGGWEGAEREAAFVVGRGMISRGGLFPTVWIDQ